MSYLGLALLLLLILSAIGLASLQGHALSVAARDAVKADRLIDAAYDRAGLLVKIEKLRAANEGLFEQHIRDTKENDDLRHTAADWEQAYASLVAEIEGDDGDPDDGEWPDDDGPDDGPDDDKVVTQSNDDIVVTDEMLNPGPAGRAWLKSNDIDWSADDA